MASSLVDGYGSHKCMQVRRVTGSGSTTPGAESRKAAQAAFVVSGTRANRLCVAIARHGLLNALAQRHHLGCVLGQAPVVGCRSEERRVGEEGVSTVSSRWSADS